MSQILERSSTAAPALPAAREAIAAFARTASIETSARNLVEIDGYASLVPAGTDVYVTWLPGMPYHHVASVAKRLRQAGMNPVPHIAARMLASEKATTDFLARLRDEARVTRALVISGDSEVPVGPYHSSLALMETGLLQAHGIADVGVAGYPEGHRKLAEPWLLAALEKKIEYARRNGMRLHIVTQFCFDPALVVDWVERLRARGIDLPARIGVAGPASVRTLLHFAMRCGIGNSIRALGTHAISLTRLMVQHGPEKVVRHVASRTADLGIAGLHVFPFGGFTQSARWIEAVRAGRFRLDEPDQSFEVQI